MITRSLLGLHELNIQILNRYYFVKDFNVILMFDLHHNIKDLEH